MKEPVSIQTAIHAYSYDLTKPADHKAYKALTDRLTEKGYKKFCSWGPGASHGSFGQRLNGLAVTLDTTCLFDNQWNTEHLTQGTNGYRIFDWAEDYRDNGDRRTGYWINVTPEMRRIRHDTRKCRYCGKQTTEDLNFCPYCIDSEYLKESDLHLTRMMRVDDTSAAAPLTDEERAERVPLWRLGQTTGLAKRGKARLAKKRADLLKSCEDAIANAQTERDGFLWLLDHGAGLALIENCIYYDHTRKFCFGWRNPLPADLLTGILTGFPYPYEVVNPW